MVMARKMFPVELSRLSTSTSAPRKSLSNRLFALMGQKEMLFAPLRMSAKAADLEAKSAGGLLGALQMRRLRVVKDDQDLVPLLAQLAVVNALTVDERCGEL